MVSSVLLPSGHGTEQDEQVRLGLDARDRASRGSHGQWSIPADRPDPISLLEEQAQSRVPDLVPIRYGRMLVSPFSFFRGAAIIMTADLSPTPVSGFDVQLCGDAHAANFGIFAGPDRQLVFDVNDFDETMVGPWEWDVKRLATSLEIAGRENGYSDADRGTIVLSCVRTYRDTMREFADMGALAGWYARLDATTMQRWRNAISSKQVSRTRKAVAKAQAKDSTRALAKLTSPNGGQPRFASDPPLLTPVQEIAGGADLEELRSFLEGVVENYAESLQPHLRHLLRNYRLVDMARKVVGVGSVGTRAWAILLVGRHAHDPLVLQAKEAEASVIERYLRPSSYSHHGERVIGGQRLMQAASDILLGWVSVLGVDGVTRDYYVRQLWDQKGSVDLQTMVPTGMKVYGDMCGWTLARAHARSGNPIAISSYLGNGDSFPRAIQAFASAYATLNEQDYQMLVRAARLNRVPVIQGV